MAQQRGLIVACMFVTTVFLSIDVSAENEFGTIHFKDDVTLTIRHTIAGTETPAILPPGAYDLDHWVIRREDANGVPWTCEG